MIVYESFSSHDAYSEHSIQEQLVILCNIIGNGVSCSGKSERMLVLVGSPKCYEYVGRRLLQCTFLIMTTDIVFICTVQHIQDMISGFMNESQFDSVNGGRLYIIIRS